MREPVPVGRGNAFPALHLGIVGPLLGRGFAIGGKLPEFRFTGFGGERDDAFSVGQEARLAITNGVIPRDFHDATGLGGEGEDLAARGEDSARSVWRNVHGCEVVMRFFDPMLAHLVEVGEQRNRDDLLVSGIQIEEPQIGAGGIDDAAVVERGRLHIEDILIAFFFDAVPLGAHGVDICDAIAIGEKVDTIFPEHGMGRGSGEIGRERDRFVFAVEAPDVLGESTLVALGLAPLAKPAGEKECVPIG